MNLLVPTTTLPARQNIQRIQPIQSMSQSRQTGSSFTQSISRTPMPTTTRMSSTIPITMQPMPTTTSMPSTLLQPMPTTTSMPSTLLQPMPTTTSMPSTLLQPMPPIMPTIMPTTLTVTQNTLSNIQPIPTISLMSTPSLTTNTTLQEVIKMTPYKSYYILIQIGNSIHTLAYDETKNKLLIHLNSLLNNLDRSRSNSITNNNNNLTDNRNNIIEISKNPKYSYLWTVASNENDNSGNTLLILSNKDNKLNPTNYKISYGTGNVLKLYNETNNKLSCVSADFNTPMKLDASFNQIDNGYESDIIIVNNIDCENISYPLYFHFIKEYADYDTVLNILKSNDYNKNVPYYTATLSQSSPSIVGNTCKPFPVCTEEEYRALNTLIKEKIEIMKNKNTNSNIEAFEGKYILNNSNILIYVILLIILCVLLYKIYYLYKK